MKKRYFVYVILLIITILIYFLYRGRNKNEVLKSIPNKKSTTIIQSKDIFKNKSVENIVQEFENISTKNKIRLNKFVKLNYDGRAFYYSKILDKRDASYMIEYTGLDVGGIFLKVDSITGENLSYVEKLILNLIEISDMEIDQEEIEEVYKKLLLDIPDEEVVNTINYKNGLNYGLQINKDNGEFVFFIY